MIMIFQLGKNGTNFLKIKTSIQDKVSAIFLIIIFHDQDQCQWPYEGSDMFCQTPMTDRCDPAYQTPQNPNFAPGRQTPEGGISCDIYYNDSIDSSGG